ncbi:hypothetical protein SM139_2878, partial [Stenotrophomonas maltophilia]
PSRSPSPLPRRPKTRTGNRLKQHTDGVRALSRRERDLTPSCFPCVSTKVDTYQQHREAVEGGVGPVAGVSAAWMPRPSPQGRVYGVPRNRTHPAVPPNACFCCCSGIGRCRAQPCRIPLHSRRISCWREQ